jgi:hypothetical protein
VLENQILIYLTARAFAQAALFAAHQRHQATMGFFTAINHLLNFFAPAAAMALVLACAGRFFKQKRPLTPYFTAQAAIIFIVSAVIYSLGLWFFGVDGKIATYAVMVVAAATTQWVLLGLWR